MGENEENNYVSYQESWKIRFISKIMRKIQYEESRSTRPDQESWKLLYHMQFSVRSTYTYYCNMSCGDCKRLWICHATSSLETIRQLFWDCTSLKRLIQFVEQWFNERRLIRNFLNLTRLHQKAKNPWHAL